MLKIHQVALALCLSIASLPAAADGFDGTQPLICAAIETFECGPGGQCLKGTADGMNVPQFIWLDFEQMMTRAKRPDGEERTSEIQSLTQNDGALILHGVQAGLGWSMAITQANGKMTLTAAGDQVAFVVFGACTVF